MHRIIHTTVSSKRNQGFSLVEMMIASTIGLMLVAAVIGLFISSKHAANETSLRGGLYENGRYALMMLSSELRVADFWGGTQWAVIDESPDLDVIAADCAGAALGYDLERNLWAMTATTVNAFGCINDAKIDSDILVVKRVAPMPTAPASIDATLTYIMTNQTLGVMFDGDDALPTTVVGGDVPNGQAWAYSNTIFYVSNNAGVPTLYRKRLQGNVWAAKEEVAVGIERLVVQFGVDNTGDGVADNFRPADNVDWSIANVVSSRVYLLVRSEDSNPSYVDNKAYQLGAVTVAAANDHYNRLVFDTSINLRNRKLMVAGGF